MVSKQLIVLRGIPGSGKSTLADELVNEIFILHSYCWLSTDDLFYVNGKYTFDKDKLHLFHQTNIARCDLAMQAGIEYIFIDNTNITFKEMEPYIKLAIKYGYSVKLEESNTPWKFDVEECFKRNEHNVPKETIQKMVDRWESMGECLQKISSLEEAKN